MQTSLALRQNNNVTVTNLGLRVEITLINPCYMRECSSPRETIHTPVMGAITLTRHGRPALSRKCMLSSQGYRDWWHLYDLGGLMEGQTPPEGLCEAAFQAEVIFSSTLPRARETAHAIADGKSIIFDALFVEAPLPPPHLPDWLKLPPRIWGVVARIWWHASDRHDAPETRSKAESRAEQAADKLIAEAEQGQDVLLLAHGYFNHMIGQALSARGWHLTLDQGFKYWCRRRFERD